MFLKYDIVVIGGGHAGCEAALAGAKMGSSVLLITMNLQTIAQMSCNPAMGGIGKGQILREIDALGGGSGIIADQSAIQFRMLNQSKGPAMWSPRTQNDRKVFSDRWRILLESMERVDFRQDMVTSLMVKDNCISGVQTAQGISILSKTVILTTGTFLNGCIHVGTQQVHGGRVAERASVGLTTQLQNLGFQTGRMKTGTSPRLDARTLDYTKMEEQPGDPMATSFSFWGSQPPKEQKSCYITYTNPKSLDLVKQNIHHSPIYNGQVQVVGPRYCPSIEDKVYRFADKQRHQIFVEPEGWNTIQTYVNGLSTSLPEEIQYHLIKSIVGFENAKILSPGYVIEYDYFPPTQLHATLETKLIQHLYFAGQINGTTGYEEAACQGLMAAINAHRKIHGLNDVVLKRSDGYIGVLIDDLVHKGTDEPYRMFTSRAEFRLLLRQDNADLRLTPLGYELGLISNHEWDQFLKKKREIDDLAQKLENWKILPNTINHFLSSKQEALIDESHFASFLLKKPSLCLDELCLVDINLNKQCEQYPKEVLRQVEIQVKYQSYLKKEKELVKKMEELDHYLIPKGFDFNAIKALSSESREKLSKHRPGTLASASKISGVTPADIAILMVYMRR